MFLYICVCTKDGDIMVDVSANLYNNSAEAKVLAKRARALGYDVQTTLAMTSRGNMQDSLDQIGVELGINKSMSDHNLTFDRHIKADGNNEDMLFQGNDGMLYNLDFTSGTVSSKSTIDFAQEHGLINEEGKFYDVVVFGQNKAEFIDYKFGGTGDGKLDTVKVNISDPKWAGIKYVNQETDYKAWTSSGGDLYSSTAREAFSNILEHASQWMSATDYEELAKCDTYEERMEKFRELAVKAMDETGEAYSEFQVEA